MDEIVPPVLVRPMFRPTCAGNDQFMGPGSSPDDFARMVDDHPLAFEGADIQSRGCNSWTALFPVEIETWPDAFESRDKQVFERHEIRKITDFEAGV